MARTIKILSAGPIKSMNGVYGPILTPYTVDDNRLRSLLREGLNIVEIMADKSEKKITLSDFNMPNNNNVKKKEPVVNSKPAPAPAKVAEPEVKVEPVVEETTTEEVASQPSDNRNYNKKYNKNKNNE